MRGAKGWEREFIPFREIGLERRWKYAAKLDKYTTSVDDIRRRQNRERDA